MSQSNFNDVVGSLLKGMGSLLSSHTVVGEPSKIDDTLIVPLVDVSFGVGAGAGSAAKKIPGAAASARRCHRRPFSLSGTDRQSL